MSEAVASRKVVIPNQLGLHARPADLFVRLASQFQANIEVVKDGERVDGKSILGILTLAAEKGSQLTLMARGDDADAALDALADLVQQGFSEEDTLEQNGTGENMKSG